MRMFIMYKEFILFGRVCFLIWNVVIKCKVSCETLLPPLTSTFICKARFIHVRYLIYICMLPRASHTLSPFQAHHQYWLCQCNLVLPHLIHDSIRNVWSFFTNITHIYRIRLICVLSNAISTFISNSNSTKFFSLSNYAQSFNLPTSDHTCFVGSFGACNIIFLEILMCHKLAQWGYKQNDDKRHLLAFCKGSLHKNKE